MTLLAAIQAHLEQEGFPIGVGVAPSEMDPSRPFAVLYGTSTVWGEDTDVVERDTDGNHLVQLKAYWRIPGQDAIVDRLDTRIRDGQLVVPGAVVHGVAREQDAGPERDDDAHPQQPLFCSVRWYRILTDPA